MSIHRCPDCVGRMDNIACPTCQGSSYVHRRDSDGRITHPADPEDYLRELRKRPTVPKPLVRGKPSRF